jgi:5-methylcytosine-specific restriction endonuclease McrA
MMGKLTSLGSRVAALPARVAVQSKVAESFYQSRDWLRLIKMIKAVRGCFCERCGSSYRVAGDHIVERKDGGADLDESNVELLCIRCHNSKTAAARKARALGKEVSAKGGG